MSCRLSSLGIGCALAVLAWGGLSLCTAHAGGKERGRAIQFSEPKSDELTTNLHQLSSRKDSLKQLEEDLSKSLQPFSSRGSLDAVAEPPPRQPSGPVVPSKRAKELLERRKNYIFMNPEDLVREPTAEEILKIPEYGPDGQEKSKVSALEHYYQRQDAKRAATRKMGQIKDEALYGTPGSWNSGGNTAARDELNLPASLRASEETLKRYLGSDSDDSTTAPTHKRNPYSDIFGLGEPGAVQDDSFKATRKSVWDTGGTYNPSRPVFGTEFGVVDTSPHPPQPMTTLSPLPAEKPHEAPQLGAINPVFVPTGPPDVNAQVGAPPSLVPVIPKAEVPKATVTTPTFSAPRRPFN